VSPVTPEGLAERAVERAALLLPRARRHGVAVRLAVDGAVEQETGALGDLVAARAVTSGVGVLRVRAADFLHRRSVRLEWGPHDVDSAFERWVDWASLQREVLEPLTDPGRLTWLPRLWDADADRPAREPVRPAAPGVLAVVDGPYLLRWELSGTFDVALHLSTSPAALLRRFPDDEDPRPGAWARYLDECDPASRADLVARHDHPDRPALLT
jgi:hypothetical protein